MQRRKRIAVLTSQPECAYLSQFMEGFLSESFRLDYDVVVFATFLKYGCFEDFQKGEVNIYNLCNFDMFDGVVLVPDFLILGDAFDKIVERIKDTYTKPVVVLDQLSDIYKSVYAPDDEGIEVLLDHIITQHNCKDIAFMTGKEGHLHSNLRLEGFRRAMKKHGLPINEDHIFYGDFWYDEGENVVAKLVSEDKLPDAICCASDTMAISVVDALKKRNIRISEDVIVTGFDSEGDGLREYHSVTSLSRRNTMLGYECARTLDAMIKGENRTLSFEPYSSLDIIHETCGCQDYKRVLKIADREKQYHTAYDNGGFDSGYNFMIEDMIGKDNLTECLWVLNWHVVHIEPYETFNLCLCDDWADIEKYMDGKPRTEGYTDEMILALVKEREVGSVDLQRKFKKEDILPAIINQSERPAVYYCTPTHFNEICIGYTVLCMGESVESYGINYSRWVRYMNVALESVHRHLVTKRMYDLMKKQALMDDLTGIHNRNGLYSLSPAMITEAIEKDQKFLVITGDLNCMKYINDNFGHNEGDDALRYCAKAFKKATEKIGGTVFRTGGDEFVYLNVGNFEIDEISNLINDIKDTYTEMITSAEKPYPAQIALGYSCAKIGAFDTMEHLLSHADSMMFKNKQKMKEETGFKYART